MTRKTVKQALDRFVRGSLDRQDIFGRTGRVNEDGSVSVLVEGNSREVHVRVDGEQASTTARHENRINTDIAGLPVIMRRVHDRLTIIRTNEAQMAAFQQGAPYTPVQLLPHQVQLGNIQQIPGQTMLGNAEADTDDVAALTELPAGVEASIDHANIQNIGTNSHADIDSHIADGAIHFPMPGVGDLADTVLDDPQDGDLLRYDDGTWVNEALPDVPIGLGDLDDVTYINTPLDPTRDQGAFILFGVSGVQGPDGWYNAESIRYQIHSIDDGDPKTIMPDGEIDHSVHVVWHIVGETTAPSTFKEKGLWTWVDVNDSIDLYNDSGEVLVFRVTAAGGIELERTSGTNTYPRVKLFFFWE